jgi:single-stranded-DNA-specific exonuclease
MSNIDPRLFNRVIQEWDIDPTSLATGIARIRAPANPRFRAGVARVVQAIQGGERVGIYGDYDADGVTAAAITGLFLRRHGLTVDSMVSKRGDGYGFSLHAAEALGSSCDLVIVFDCGSLDIAACNLCRNSGADLIVVDHHTVPEGDPADHPAILINPRAETDWETPYCSAGLSWLLCAGAARRIRRPIPLDLLDLAAIGTVADMVPLIDGNRSMVRFGIDAMSRQLRAPLKAMARVGGFDVEGIDAKWIGWKVGPRLNAPGRMGDAMPALDLLSATRWDTATARARKLEAINRERRNQQDAAMQGVEITDLGWCVIGRGTWTAGISGVIAARVADEWDKPALIVTAGGGGEYLSGSARGRGRIPVYPALADAQDILGKWGGHPMACGFGLKASDWEKFCNALRAHVPQPLETEGAELAPIPVRCGEIDVASIRGLDALRPWGRGNPVPVFELRGAKVVSTRRMGAERQHMKIRVRQDGVELDVLAWNTDVKSRAGKVLYAVGELEVNTYNGAESPQFVASELRVE